MRELPEEARRAIGAVSALPWPPPLEIYCQSCRRMVEARPYGGGQSLIPVRHYRVNLNAEIDSRDSRTCEGIFHPGNPDYKPGMEDPVAAFHFTLVDRTLALRGRDKRMRSLIEIWTNK